MSQLFGLSTSSLLKRAEKLKQEQINSTSKYIVLSTVELNDKGKFCFTIKREDRPKLNKLYKTIVVTPVSDNNFKFAIAQESFCNLDDVAYKVVKASKNYIELLNMEDNKTIITVIIEDDEDNVKDIKKKITKIKAARLSNSLIGAYLNLDNKKDKDRYLSELEGLIRVSKGYKLKAIKKAIKEIS